MSIRSYSTSRVIPASEYRRERWRNQLGWTREIYKSPDGGEWDVRLSIAEIERDSAFSAFPGVEHSFGPTPRRPGALPEETGAKAVADAAKPAYGPASDDPS